MRPPDAATIERWYDGKTFSSNWTKGLTEGWAAVLAPLSGRGARLLEIGSWEGRSALFFLNVLPDCRLTCIDTFGGGREHRESAEWRAELPEIERRFDSNLAAFSDRLRKVVSASVPALHALGEEQARFEMVYVDGSHERDDVLVDALLAWKLLAPGGLLIFDDYGFAKGKLPEALRPAAAVDAFLHLHRFEYRVVSAGRQVILERLAEPLCIV